MTIIGLCILGVAGPADRTWHPIYHDYTVGQSLASIVISTIVLLGATLLIVMTSQFLVAPPAYGPRLVEGGSDPPVAQVDG